MCTNLIKHYGTEEHVYSHKKRNFGVKQLILQNVKCGNEQKEKILHAGQLIDNYLYGGAKPACYQDLQQKMYGRAPQFHIHKGSILSMVIVNHAGNYKSIQYMKYHHY